MNQVRNCEVSLHLRFGVSTWRKTDAALDAAPASNMATTDIISAEIVVTTLSKIFSSFAPLAIGLRSAKSLIGIESV